MDYTKLTVSLSLTEPIDDKNRDFTSAIRGIWGRSLKRIFCLQRDIRCEDCDFDNCTYRLLFYKKYSSRENFHPYIIREINKNEKIIEVEFTLFGYISLHMDKIIPSIIGMGHYPLIYKGKRIFFEINTITDHHKRLVFDRKARIVRKPKVDCFSFPQEILSNVRMQFETPLRMKYQNKLMRTFHFETVIQSLARRADYINSFFNNNSLVIPRINITSDLKKAETKNCRFEWNEIIRKSFIRNQKMFFGGLVGSVDIFGLTSETYQLLRLGEILQVGKQTSFGMGKYHLIEIET